MNRIARTMLLIGALGIALPVLPAAAQSQSGVRETPKNWSYEIRDGKRVPKADRQLNADGSWREEVRRGNCVTIKEKSASGEYKETRRCD